MSGATNDRLYLLSAQGAQNLEARLRAHRDTTTTAAHRHCRLRGARGRCWLRESASAVMVWCASADLYRDDAFLPAQPLRPIRHLGSPAPVIYAPLRPRLSRVETQKDRPICRVRVVDGCWYLPCVRLPSPDRRLSTRRPAPHPRRVLQPHSRAALGLIPPHASRKRSHRRDYWGRGVREGIAGFPAYEAL
jgi:hypothetical protein